MESIELFIKEKMEFAKLRENEANKLRESFVRDFPIEELFSMEIDQYLIAKEGYGNENSFCRRIRYELEPIAHMGNVRFDIFGIYLNEGTNLTLSKTYSLMYGMDFNKAFYHIKEDIIKLLDAVENNDYKFIEESNLNSSFKYKLIMIYFPEKFIPVCTKGTLDKYCKSVGLDLDSKVEMVFKNLALLEWKNSMSQIETWSNTIFMSFCDWLWRSERKVFGDSLLLDINKANLLTNEIDELNLHGETRNAVVKIRVNQGVFRERLLKKYSKCCLCEVSKKDLLTASHIKPWSNCKPEEKLDVDNGFLLCPNHDKLFDKGWISFTEEGIILISNEISEMDRIYLNIKEDLKINLTEKNKEYLKYHRNILFYKS